MPRKNQIGKGLSTFMLPLFCTGYVLAAQLESAVWPTLGLALYRLTYQMVNAGFL
jgi:hypothetical protein